MLKHKTSLTDMLVSIVKFLRQNCKK